MKFSVFLLSGLTTAMAAHAQVAVPSGVQLYGIIDEAVEHLNHVASTGGSLTRMPSITGSLPSRWGMRGSEDLGDGYRTVFTLEAGFAPDTGASNQGGRLFGRQAFVGLASPTWGTLSFGRQYSMYFLAMLDAGILGPNIYGTGSLDTYIPQARFDNTVAWQGKWGPFTAGANYSLGRDGAAPPAGTGCAGESATDAQACRAASAMLKYDTDSWGTAVAWDRQRGGAGAAAGLTSSRFTDQRIFVTAYTKFNGWKIGAGWVRRDNEGTTAIAKTSDLAYVEASYAVTPQLSVDGQVAKLDYQNSTAGATLLSLRGTYALSKRTALYGTVGRIHNSGPLALSVSAGSAGGLPAAGMSQTGISVGARHAF
ncbi:porin [Rhodoferax sp.]|uniref:porin n=1 Tax=Rhodoferax sp. TaxID=50421 RepID=UPI00374CCDFF